jgi:hypothetical protein
MNRWTVTNPWIFYGLAGLVVGYVLLMMFTRRKGERPGVKHVEREL